MPEREDLLAAIRAIEAQRDILGAAAVETTVGPLRARLAALGDALSAPPPSPEGERKQVTVMFADLSGFTTLSETADAEDVRNLVNSCFERLGSIATRMGGYIDKFIGDELMVLFGAPRSLEDHASRALLAALEMRDALVVFNGEHAALRSNPLGMHFGINSGLVIAGGMGLEAKREYTVMGDPVNVAARLAAQAPTGSIFVGADTRRLVGPGFQFDERGALTLEGRAQKVDVFELTSLTEAAHTTRQRQTATALVGRSDELRTLQDMFDSVAAESRSRSVAIVGPAGIGKSRLFEEFRTWASTERPEALLRVGAALPHTSTTPYHLVADLIRGALDVRELDAAAAIRGRLDERLHDLNIDDTSTGDALAMVLGIESDAATADIAPRARRARITSAIVNVVRAIGTRSPVVLAFEDLHWADIQSIELLKDLSAELKESRILFLTLTRPITDDDAKAREVEAQLLSAANARIVLDELGSESCVELVRALAPGLEAWPDALQTIIRKGQGNPFFVQAIVGTLVDQGIVVHDENSGQVSVSGAIDDVTVPDTVWGVLAERIDRLSADNKQALQMAAVIGLVFWEGLLGDLTESGASLDAGLRSLEERALIDSVGPAAFDGDWEWTFRHMLVHEVAYAGMLKSVRRSAHLRVGNWLEQRADDRREELAPLLSYHFGRGEDWAKAAEFAEVAAGRAARIYANREAAAAYRQAVEALTMVPPDAATQRRTIELALKFSSVALDVPADEVLPVLERAKALAQELGDGELILRVQGGIGAYLWVKTSRRRF
ncbi:MAG: AAA family ATPase [Chloroflexi bacterium]|nr:AAA family ATPase [Chloroflexota bacterium]